ncbi:hypothetical protein C2S52_003403, partial [Perilla frutescens var. hirtella]
SVFEIFSYTLLEESRKRFPVGTRRSLGCEGISQFSPSKEVVVRRKGCMSVRGYETLGDEPVPPRKKVAIEGVVYCKICTSNPNNSFHLVSQLTPLAGAVVKLQCNNTNKGWEEQTQTEEKGSFLMMPNKVTTWGIHKCKLFLVSSPRPDCILPSPWKLGFPLTATTTPPSTSTLQYFTTAAPLLYYYYWPHCI